MEVVDKCAKGGDMARFVGRFDHTLDAKGRVILPARYRPEFHEGAADLTQHFEGCLALWTHDEFTRQEQQMLDLYAGGTPSARNRARSWAQGASPVDIDKQGRVALPAGARRFADLTSDVIVIGAIDHIELWSPARFDQQVVPAEEYFSGSDLA
jgi:MraZ protein